MGDSEVLANCSFIVLVLTLVEGEILSLDLLFVVLRGNGTTSITSWDSLAFGGLDCLEVVPEENVNGDMSVEGGLPVRGPNLQGELSSLGPSRELGRESLLRVLGVGLLLDGWGEMLTVLVRLLRIAEVGVPAGVPAGVFSVLCARPAARLGSLGRAGSSLKRASMKCLDREG